MNMRTKQQAVLQKVTMVLFFRPGLPVVRPSMNGILQRTGVFTHLRHLPTCFLLLFPAVHSESATTTTRNKSEGLK